MAISQLVPGTSSLGETIRFGLGSTIAGIGIPRAGRGADLLFNVVWPPFDCPSRIEPRSNFDNPTQKASIA
jgi:hypothetical protein